MSNPFKISLMAIRPKTLPASIAPVAVGTAMAYGDGVQNFEIAGLCLAGALAIQIGTNLANDFFDFKKGADTADRIGPTRVTQAGLVKPWIMILAMTLFFGLAAYIGFILYQRGGTPIAVIAVTSILSGILYTAGPRPLGYLGLGDLFVLIFFGPVAVAGTYYIQSLEMNLAVLLAGLGPGFLSMGVLAVNNLRDIEGDRKAGKKTLAVRFGAVFARQEYLFCVLAASIVPIIIFLAIQDHSWILIASFTSLIAIPAMRVVCHKSDGPSLNQALAFTGLLLLIYSLLFSIGWIYETQ